MLFKLLSATTRDWDPVVVSLMDKGSIGPRISELGISVYDLGLRRGAPNPTRALRIIPLARRFRPQLIQGWMYHGNLMASLAAVSSQSRIPVLWNIRQTLYDIADERRLTATVIRLGGLLSRHPAAIIYNSQTSARHHEALGYNGANRVVIPNGFNCKMFRPDNEARRQVRVELGVGNDTVLVGLIARYHPMKDHAGFLRSAALVAQVHPEVHFLLAGNGVTTDEPALRELIDEQQLQDRTHLLGERSDITRLVAALDIACSASAWGEGFSNAIGEAMSCGIPCVVTEVGDTAYLVADTGLSVRPRDPRTLAQALSQLIAAGPASRRQLGEAARKRIETDFSLPAIVRRYEDLYRKHVAREVFTNH
jgi:glycosyltransferase involved in cell wall biosynthesis